MGQPEAWPGWSWRDSPSQQGEPGPPGGGLRELARCRGSPAGSRVTVALVCGPHWHGLPVPVSAGCGASLEVQFPDGNLFRAVPVKLVIALSPEAAPRRNCVRTVTAHRHAPFVLFWVPPCPCLQPLEVPSTQLPRFVARGWHFLSLKALCVLGQASLGKEGASLHCIGTYAVLAPIPGTGDGNRLVPGKHHSGAACWLRVSASVRTAPSVGSLASPRLSQPRPAAHWRLSLRGSMVLSRWCRRWARRSRG